MDDIVALVMAGGRGSRLRPLTNRRSKPVVPFAGRRLIDFTLDNCVRSRLRDVVVLAQERSDGVARHVRSKWASRFGQRCVYTAEEAGRPFHGTADAIRAGLKKVPRGDRILVLAGDHVYRMDYRRLLADHLRARADATLSVVTVPRCDASSFGVPEVDDEGVLKSFAEKPNEPSALPGRPDVALASMGIYLFDRRALAGYLADHRDAVDFGHDVVPGMLAEGRRLAAHVFHARAAGAYWRDIADLDAYHGALMDLVASDFEPTGAPEVVALPARFRRGPGDSAPGVARDSWIGPGSVVAGGVVEGSVIGAGVRVDHHAEVVESVLLDGVVVGPHARLRRVVVEKGVRIPTGAVLGYGPFDPAPGLSVTPGGVIFVATSRW